MVIDLDKCTGCQACVVACRAENNVPVAGPDQAEKGRGIFWMHLLPTAEGEFPRVKPRFMPMPCNHCDQPACVRVCPVNATYKNEDGVVAQIYTRCIGCRFCTVACPYTRRYFNWYDPQWPEETKAMLNPEVYVRTRGVVEKCTFCSQRIRAGKARAKKENRPLRDGDIVPACVESCPTKAMFFGDLDDPNSMVAQLERSPRAFRVLEDLGTHPKVIYLTEGEWRGQP
ncbi:MAG: 4Fe-4S dicluster domain-containing protein [Chloroflexi bacterium]|nr:4Fe-4S dicluster domain-containing protein [Chloroflexota bacterium]